MSSRLVRLSALFVAVVSVGVTGCGGDTPPIGAVSGTITLNGQPLEGATVEFAPAKGRGSIGVTDDKGTYVLKYTNTVDGALVGEHTVRITTGAPRSASNEGGDSPGGKPERIPPAYNSQSEVKAEVKAGSNTFDYDIDSGGQTFPLLEGGSKRPVNDA